MASAPAVTFIFTNSHDVTTDMLVSKLGTERVFRFNFNLWQDYKIQMTSSGFEIENPVGRKVTDREVAKFYWRKPMRSKDLTPEMEISDRTNYIEEELWYMMREAMNLLWSRGLLVLVEPFADVRCGKLVQARAASRYFNVPPFKCVFGSPRAPRSGRKSVVKSLSSTRVDKDSVFYTTAVDETELDISIPWTIQELVMAEKDVTIAVVRDSLFAFELLRRPFVDRTLDWRELATEYVTDEWRVHSLPPGIARGAVSLMADLQLQFGRIDMLVSEGAYHFLEVNPNGEWGWLDASGTHGLLGKIIDEISPDTPLHPLPTLRPPRES
jgi:hypothetical protein